MASSSQESPSSRVEARSADEYDLRIAADYCDAISVDQDDRDHANRLRALADILFAGRTSDEEKANLKGSV